MKIILLLFVLLLIIGFGGKFVVDYINKHGFPSFEKNATVKIGTHSFSVKVAKTSEEQQIGLSKTESLSKTSGMLFPFQKADYYAFWMKNMKFPIDILYINNKKIVTIFENVPAPASPNENPPLYHPTEPATMVLEIQGGLVTKYTIKEGDTVTIENL